jgi:hypothetical protein
VLERVDEEPDARDACEEAERTRFRQVARFDVHG